MNRLCIFLLAVGLAQGGRVALEHVGQITSQYHSQDELGQYSYGYAGGPSAKEEIKTADGVTRGGYSYIDAHGIVQSASYVSDPVNGFRVAATNLPTGPAVPAGPSAIVAAPAAIAAPALVAAAPAAVAAPALVAAPAPVASIPTIVSAPAPIVADTIVAEQPLISAAPAAVVEGPAVTATNVQELAAPAADLPEVVAARSVPTVLATSSSIAHPLAASSWSGLVHHLKKRSLAAATIVTPYTSYPGSTAPLVHATPLVAAPVVATSPIVSTVPLISAHPALVATPAIHGWSGLAHSLKKRSVLLASPLVAGHLVALPHAEPLHTALLRQSHDITRHQEALRNTAGVIPLNSPADTPDVEITKVNHLLQVAAEGQRNTYGGLAHLLRKRSIIATPLIATSLIDAHYAEPLHTALLRQAHDITRHQEALRNTAGVIPLNSPADTPDVEITKVNHLLQVAAEGQRNTYGGLAHLLRKRSIIATPLIATTLIGAPHAEPLHTALLRQAHDVTRHQEALRNTAGVIPLNSPADTPEVEITKVNHLLQVAAEGQRNTYGGLPLITRSVLPTPLIGAHPLIAHW